MARKITVLLVESLPRMHQGLHTLLVAQPDITVIGEAGDGKEAVERVQAHAPDVVVMDLNMPELNGINATERIVAASPETKVVVLSIHAGKPFVDDMLRAGATGCVLKENAPEELVRCIRAVRRGDLYLSTAITGTGVAACENPLPARKVRARHAQELLPAAADTRSPAPILHTRLHRPPTTPDLVVRLQLMERLNRGRLRPLTLVSAPAGYGKSTLVSSWLDTCDYPSAWLSLDEGDNELSQFLRYLVAAVRCISPAALGHTLILANALSAPPVSVLAVRLTNELDQLEAPIILVLDDYHRIRNAAVHNLLAELLRYPPRPLHLVLATRQDPLLLIDELRARDQITEIRAADLRFTAVETARFLKKASPDQIVDAATAEAWTEKTEGWVTGLRLLVLSLRHHNHAFRQLTEIKHSDRYVSDYLRTEVLTTQPAPMRRLLLGISLAERFCAPLCDAMARSANAPEQHAIDGASFIARLRASNLFLVPLDTEGHWFRYHHLFQSLLQDQLRRECSPEEIAALHTRASQWFEGQSLIEEAIRHALLAGDNTGAVQLVERHRHSALSEDKWYVLEQWLSMLPAVTQRQRPELLLAQAWIHHFRFRFAAIPPIIAVAESLLHNSPTDQSLQGEVDFFKGVVCFVGNDGARSLRYLASALQRIPLAHDIIRARAEVFLGLARQLQGQHTLAARELNDLLCSHQGQHGLRARLLAAIVFIHIISGDLAKAFMVNRQLREVFTKWHDPYARAWMSYLQGLIHLFRNELNSAIHHFSQAVACRYILQARAAVDCMAGLSLAYQAAQQTQRARATLELLFEYVSAAEDPFLVDVAHSCKARLSLLQGGSVFELDPLRLGEEPNDKVMLFWLEVPAITRCRVLVAEGSQASLREAESKLQACLQLSRDQHNIRHQIDVLLLLATIRNKQDRVDEGLAFLKPALDLATPGSWIRSFVELGAPMADLLVELQRRRLDTAFVRQLLNVLRCDQPRPVAGPSSCTLPPSRDGQPLLWESLTNRERDVLELLAQRLQNKEIAARLHISPETVKTHLRNLYQKLNVSTRRQAVARTPAIAAGRLATEAASSSDPDTHATS